MSAPQFTPGPWKVSSGAEGVGVYASYRLALMTGGEAVRDKANAHLIVAAPELYEALAEAEKRICFIARHDEDNETAAVVMGARAALAKARGEQ